MSKEAMKLALEALEHVIYWDNEKPEWEYAHAAITALRKALAEHPAQQEPFGYFKAEPFGWTDCAETDEGAVALYATPQPAQQEPVATVTSESGNPNVLMSWWHEPALPVGTKLYELPPAQRTWVGLTDEETGHWAADFLAGAKWAEAKLKEKNT